jgi:predicted component of type VI protein secretion system
MAERARLKGDYDLERTTIGAAANNPFKWTPPRKLARDLLSERNNGFLSGPAAVCACFDDLTTHMTALSDTADATLKQALQMLSPEAIETEAKAQTSLLRSRQAVCWEILVRRHAECVGTSRPSAGG